VSVRFELGVVCATPGAILELGPALIAEVLGRHASGDWGDLGEFDRHENDLAVRKGLRVFSAYETPSGRAWVITEADRSSTTVLLPGEY
jgi:hypothetical protein